MTVFAFWALLFAALMGMGLAFLVVKPVWPHSPLAAAIHGVAGTFGLALLALALKNEARPAGTLAATLANLAAVLIALAWVAGLVAGFLPVASRTRFISLILLHGVLAVLGCVLLAVFCRLP